MSVRKHDAMAVCIQIFFFLPFTIKLAKVAYIKYDYNNNYDKIL